MKLHSSRYGRLLGGLGIIVALAFAVTACGGSASEAERTRLLRGTTGEIATLDPHFSLQSEALSVLSDLYEGLVRLNAAGAVEPGVASDWTVSADGLTYTFRLRENARWSDGTALTAQDFVWSFRRLVDPATAAPQAATLAMLQNAGAVIAGDALPDALGVAALDDRTLELTLAYPAPYLLSALTRVAAAPLHAASIERYDRLFTRPGHLVSNGPYLLAERLEQQYIELDRNPHHWHERAPAIESVRYIPFDEGFAQLTAYRVGQIDLTDTVPVSGEAIVREQFPEEMHVRAAPDTFYYAFNLRQGALVDAPALRQALSMAVAREVIVDKVTAAGQTPAYSFVPPTFGGYDPPSIAFADRDAAAREEHARTLLRGEELPRLRVLYNTNDGLRRITVAVTSMWRETLGVESELTNQEFGVFLQTLRDPAAWDVARLSWRADFDDPYAFLEIFASGSPNNFVGYSDPAYDDLLERSLRELDPERRLELLKEAERRLLDAHAIAPIFFYVDRVLAKPWVDIGNPATIKALPTAHLSWRSAD